MSNKVSLRIWGRDFLLEVDYDIFDDEVATQEQIDTFDNFVSHPDWIEKAKDQVEKYCKKSVLSDDENMKKDNIFSYVKPDYLFVKNETKYHRVALMCKYRYDEEHGLAVVFDSEGKVTVGDQDIIL